MRVSPPAVCFDEYSFQRLQTTSMIATSTNKDISSSAQIGLTSNGLKTHFLKTARIHGFSRTLENYPGFPSLETDVYECLNDA